RCSGPVQLGERGERERGQVPNLPPPCSGPGATEGRGELARIPSREKDPLVMRKATRDRLFLRVFLVLGAGFMIAAAIPGDGVQAAAKLPAFPGAEGAGAHTPGGRGVKVYFIPNVNDHGPGSLREAVEAQGPRTVLFRVAGIIHLETPLSITHPFITIAGQTAPGDGVCIRNQTFEINTHDVVLRY